MNKSIPETEPGQVLVIFALAAIGIFAIVGLTIDGSAKFSDRRHAQNAADTAAMAAALARVRAEEQSLSAADVELAMRYAARDRAAANGYDGFVNDQVWVYYCSDLPNDSANYPARFDSPVDCGPYEGHSRYIQVVIQSEVNTYFARVLGIHQTQNIVQAVALTREGQVLGDGAMIISYDPDPNCSTGGTGGYSVQVNGSSSVNLNGGGIFLNSDEVCGFKIPNCADLNISSGTINSAGDNVNIPSGCTIDPPITPNLNQEAIVIPDDVYWPDEPPECNMSGYPTPTKLGEVMAGSPPKLTEEWLIYPGYYTTFPQATLVANKSHIYMASGVYCIDPGGPGWNGDLSWSSVDSARLNGSTDSGKNKYQDPSNPLPDVNPDGVTLYIKTGGGFTLNSNNPTLLDASTTGDYQGYLIILEGTHTSIENCSITGGADLDINGLIFAPYCNITVNGGSSSTAVINAQLLGWDILVNGGAGVNFNYDPSNQVTVKHQIGLMR
jgi:hypothetical protein